MLGNAAPLGTETARISDLRDRVFAEDLVCPFDVPHFDNSQVDGYAVRVSDQGPRKLIGQASAGSAGPRVGAGEAVRIFTGASLPAGANAVVMQEDVTVNGGTVVLPNGVRAGDFIRRQGEEITLGSTYSVTGCLATPPLIGLAASFGRAEVNVFHQSTVGIVATGDELILPGNPLGPGQIYSSNLGAIGAALDLMGVRSTQKIVRDDPSETKQALAHALDQNDVLVTIGGVSVGDRDYVRSALTELGVQEVLWRVAMKPGKPFYFGKLGNKLIFGLPGNPVSALVTFQLLVRPALRKMLGMAIVEEETTAVLAGRIERTDPRYEFVRAVLASGVATPAEHQGSHMQSGLAFADCLLHLPAGVALFVEGSSVSITPMRWGLC